MFSFCRYIWLPLFIVALAGCSRTQPIYNVESSPILIDAQHRVSSEQVGSLIKKAVLDTGWVIGKDQPGFLHCSLKFRQHKAVVDISYTERNYSIRHVSSENLLEGSGKIHHKYNDLIHQLQDEIDKALSKLLNG